MADDGLIDGDGTAMPRSPYARPGSPSYIPVESSTASELFESVAAPAAPNAVVDPVGVVDAVAVVDPVSTYPQTVWQPDESLPVAYPISPVPIDEAATSASGASTASDAPGRVDADVPDVIDIGDVRDGVDAVPVAAARGRSAWATSVRRLSTRSGRRRGRPAVPVIELGLRHGRVDLERPRPAPTGRLDLAGLLRAQYRMVAFAVVIVVALVIGGSMAPPMPRLAHLADIIMPPGAALALDGSRAVVLASRDSVGESVAAYNLSHGDRAWFTELPVRQSDDLGMTVSDGVILVAGGTLGSRGPHTLAIDEKTGRLLWTSGLNLVSPRRGSDTALMSNQANGLTSNGAGGMFAIDKRTGKVRWYVSVGAACTTDEAVPGEAEVPTAVVELCTDTGQLTRFDLDDGTVGAAIHVPLPTTDRLDSLVFTVGDVVVVQDSRNQSVVPAFSGFDLDTLTPLWTRDGFTVTDTGHACEGQICVSSGGQDIHLDPRTGVLLPTLPHASELTAPVPQPFVSSKVIGTLLLVSPRTMLTLVNQATYVATPVADLRVVHAPLYRPGRTWVATMSDSGVRDDLQLLDGPAADVCVPFGGYLGCMTSKHTMTFWRLPPVD
jgi:hypothetical protein